MVRQAKAFLTRLHRDDTGAMAVEKVLLIALIALPLIITMVVFKNTIVKWFTGQQTELQNQSGQTAG